MGKWERKIQESALEQETIAQSQVETQSISKCSFGIMFLCFFILAVYIHVNALIVHWIASPTLRKVPFLGLHMWPEHTTAGLKREK